MRGSVISVRLAEGTAARVEFLVPEGSQAPENDDEYYGVPVEQEINKSLNLSGRKEVLAYGVDRYNEACRGIVKRYATEWRTTVRRIGRWVDMDDAYYTMDASFMQSVWWVFKQLWDKGLIYEDHKVVPYSVGISTALSNGNNVTITTGTSGAQYFSIPAWMRAIVLAASGFAPVTSRGLTMGICVCYRGVRTTR